MQDEIDPDASEELLADEIDIVVPTRGYQQVPIVGIGGSAGSIEALQNFFSAMGPAPGMAFVVVIHLAREHESTLAELLQRKTSMRVIQVREPQEVEPGTVYVIPPGKSLRAADGQLSLGDLPSMRTHHVAVDIFFRTLADTHGAHAAAVVLSGEDGDGAIGIKRIKERGGLTIAQDPADAQRPGMPTAAIDTGMVDWVLPVRDMPARIQSYFEIEKDLELPPEHVPAPTAGPPNADPKREAALRDVLAFLRTRTGRDFSFYKRATILRRIARRMQVNSVDNLGAYLECLRTRPGEPGALLQDLLISVTNFFRDRECFKALQDQVPSLFEGKGQNDTVRVWVAGCATGEEAYSIAMMLAEHARTLDAPPALQVFATDLDDSAVQFAREGIYPLAIEADVDEARLAQFFVKEHRGWRVRRELRETVLFAIHDLLKDSPFSRLDLVSCRNLLIYLNREGQARALETFHFALLPQAKLFLGASETVEEGSPLFSVVDKKRRIYAQRSAPRTILPLPTGPRNLAIALDATSRDVPVVAGRYLEPQEPRIGRTLDGRTSWGEMHLRLLEHLAPPSIVVDSEYEIVHLSPGAGRFLQHGGGEPSRNLLRSVQESVRIDLRAALYRASQSHASVEVPRVSVQVDGKETAVTLRVTPARDLGISLFLVTFEALPDGNPASKGPARRTDDDPAARQLDRELERMKSHLRDTVEEYEASTEELKASNEELQAMNEELRSATEELETSREELQSINEELTTVNLELKNKVEELAHSNSDLRNLMGATAIATVFLDRELRITLYTPSAVELFNVIPTDIGRPLTHLTSQLAYPDLAEDAKRVLDRLAPIEREVQSGDHWYLARMLPYRTTDERIAGVVLSFVEITQRKRSEEVQRWLAAVVKATPDAIISFSLDHTILSWNAGAERILGHAAEEATGKKLALVAVDSEDEQRDFVARIAAGQVIEHHDTLWRRKDGTVAPVSLAASPIRDASGKVIAGTAVARDTTAARAAMEALGRSEERLRLVIESLRDYAIFSMDLDRRITTWNSGAQRMLGYTQREALRMRVDQLFTPEDRNAKVPQEQAAAALANGRADDERMHMRRDGSSFACTGSLALMHDDAGRAIGFVNILQERRA